jgi:hypothetical protein
LALFWGSAIASVATRDLRRQPMVRLLLVQLALYFVGMCVFNQKLTCYLIHIVPIYAAISAVWLSWIWSRGQRFQYAVVTGLCFLLAIELAGILVKSYTRSPLEAQRKVTEFVRAQAAKDAKINGTAGLSFAMNFDPRLQDDAYLGVDTGRTPDIIVVEQFYESLYDGWRTRRPDDMARISERLSEYQVKFSADGYRVYMR